MRTCTLPLLSLATFSCVESDDASSHDDSGTTCDSAECEGDADSDTDADTGLLDFTVTWDGTGALVSISNDSASVTHFGIAETGKGMAGWYGEDCYAGSSGQQFCHPMPPTGGYLPSIDGIAELDDGHTLLTASSAIDLTYVVIADDECVTKGQETAYYGNALDCSVR